MTFLSKRKDGGPESHVTGYWLVEIKGLFSVALLHFSPGSREAYHSHAFNAVSWLLKGRLHEYGYGGEEQTYLPSLKPICTPRSRFHKVVSTGDSWALTFRGRWTKRWSEITPNEGLVTYAHGRTRVY